MNADLIKNLIELVTALLPPVIFAVSFFGNRLEIATEPINSPSLKVLSILRVGFDDEDWRKIKRDSAIKFAFYTIIYLLIVSSLVILFIKTRNSILEIVTITLYLLLCIYFLNYGVTSILLLKLHDPKTTARYFVFKTANLVVEADYHYLFNKCHETLRNMHFQVIEVNEGERFLEACLMRTWHRRLKPIKIRLEPMIENSENLYNVSLEFLVSVGLLERSKVTNSFIDKLISEPKKTKDKAQSQTGTA